MFSDRDYPVRDVIDLMRTLFALIGLVIRDKPVFSVKLRFVGIYPGTGDDSLVASCEAKTGSLAERQLQPIFVY